MCPDRSGWSSAAVVALALLFACGGCHRHEAAKKAAPPRTPLRDVQVGSARVSLRWQDRAGRPILAVKAKTLTASEATQKVILKAATCRLYQDEKLSSVLTAPRIQGDGEKRTLAASQGALVKSSDGQSYAKADFIRWEADRHKIYGRGNVAIRWRGAELTGDEFTADTGLGRVEITSKSNGKGRLR